MNIESVKNNWKELSYTEKTRIINVIVYGFFMFFSYNFQNFVVIMLLLYINLFLFSLFIILELKYVVYKAC